MGGSMLAYFIANPSCPQVYSGSPFMATLGGGIHGKCGQIGGTAEDEVHERVLMRIR